MCLWKSTRDGFVIEATKREFVGAWVFLEEQSGVHIEETLAFFQLGKEVVEEEAGNQASRPALVSTYMSDEEMYLALGSRRYRMIGLGEQVLLAVILAVEDREEIQLEIQDFVCRSKAIGLACFASTIQINCLKEVIVLEERFGLFLALMETCFLILWGRSRLVLSYDRTLTTEAVITSNHSLLADLNMDSMIGTIFEIPMDENPEWSSGGTKVAVDPASKELADCISGSCLLKNMDPSNAR
jgi:hypothetical protein